MHLEKTLVRIKDFSVRPYQQEEASGIYHYKALWEKATSHSYDFDNKADIAVGAILVLNNDSVVRLIKEKNTRPYGHQYSIYRYI